MKKYLLVLIILGPVLVGCTSHYYDVNRNGVHFYLEMPNSEKVYFLSSLDGYKPHRAKEVGPDRWQVNLPADREFTYFYYVDGNIFVPPCRLRENDDFGSQNCIYIPGM